MKRQDSANTGESDAHNTPFSRDFQVPISSRTLPIDRDRRNGTRIETYFEKSEIHQDSDLI